jgi:hypothetical protein
LILENVMTRLALCVLLLLHADDCESVEPSGGAKWSSIPYDRLLDANGKAIDNPIMQGVVEHGLERLYADHDRGDPRAQAVVEAVELRFAYIGRMAADRASRPDCLVSPEFARGCLPKVPILNGQNSPAATRLARVTSDAFEKRLGELKTQRLLTEAGFKLLTAVTVWGATMKEVAATEEGSLRPDSKEMPAPGESSQRTAGSANPATQRAAIRGSKLHSDQPGNLPDQLRKAYPKTQFKFKKPGEAGQDVEVVGGAHPSDYPQSSWPTGVNYADFKPDTLGGRKTFNYDQRNKWSEKTYMLRYDPETGQLK